MRRRDEVPASIARVARAANAHQVALLSHDDASPEQRRWFRALGCRVSEFPMTIETAAEAAAAGDHIVLGAPNVMRGKSHLGWVNASDMIARGLCSVLASDYYYPGPAGRAFRLAEIGVAPIEKAWPLVSARRRAPSASTIAAASRRTSAPTSSWSTRRCPAARASSPSWWPAASCI